MGTNAMVPSEDGRWISDEFGRLAEVISGYDHHLELRWIPPEHRTRDDKKPYVIWDTVSNNPILFASELDTPPEILATLFQIDAAKSGHVLARLESMERASDVMKTKSWLEDLEALQDQAIFLIDSPLNILRMDGKKFDEQRRVIGPAVNRKIIT